MHRLKVVPLIVCAAVLGNPFPVVESPGEPGSFEGKAITSKAFAHVAVVARDPKHKGSGDPLPCIPELWEKLRPKTEVVMNETHLLPLGVLLVSRK